MAAEPPRKRARAKSESVSASTSVTPSPKSYQLFAPFRALGLITNHVPFALQLRSFKGATDGPKLHILTCLGKSWALWEGGKMGLLFVSPDAPDVITSMAVDGDVVWACAGSHALKYLRGKEVLRLANPLGTNLASTLVFGTQLLTLTDDGSRLLVWDTAAEAFQCEIEFENGFTAAHVMHPATYLNKVVVGSAEGSLQLWNIRSRTCIHKFPASKLSTSSSPSAVTCLAQSPAIDVIGVGFASGEVSVYDIRADEQLMRVFVREGGVRSLAFRSDGYPVLATAAEAGHITLWDLNANGRLLHTVRGAHDGGITAVEWVAGQPVLISSGEDNSVKQWLFDSPASPPRLLKFRSGHHSPPHLIRYYGEDGKQLLTASRDRSLRCMSVVRDSRSFELSQGSLAKKATSLSIPIASLKLPPVAALSFSSTRWKDWDDVLTVHSTESFARTWSLLNKRKGSHNFDLADASKDKNIGAAKAVCVSACGNFGLAASSTGAIGMWNMQSGIHRRTFELGSTPAGVTKSRAGKKGEERSITGLAADLLNKTVIASTLDGTLNFFDFHTAKLEHTVVLPSSVVSIMLQRDSNLLAAVCDDMVVRLIDIETRRTVREFTGFAGRILDIAFTPDSRWLIATSLDSVIRTFDIPTGRLIDVFRTPSVATSISFSPSGDFLATSHVDSVGVYLWANRAQYTQVSFRSIPDESIPALSLPVMQGEDLNAADGSPDVQPLTADTEDLVSFVAPPSLDGDLVTLTHLPRARWQTLLNLEVIQQRNKPKEPPKPPEKAPFFLPTLSGVEQRFVMEDKRAQEGGEVSNESFFSYTKTLLPAALDLELRSLTALDHLAHFLRALTQRLTSRQDFEAVQTYLAVLVRVHGDVLVANLELRQHLEALLAAQRRESGRVLELIAASLGTLAFVRDTL
ncbi:Utp21-domain-containing protein [Vararia minispora EC-137]|uniref:Utp21-domain-containing protein n=1 Tax=Vararia minispora EC-137 TaxID=1314806 RepID=A0ACB8QJK3_9AGAM|nr:Utp21-domain-containing protein [Vararia minispora EC-137]